MSVFLHVICPDSRGEGRSKVMRVWIVNNMPFVVTQLRVPRIHRFFYFIVRETSRYKLLSKASV